MRTKSIFVTALALLAAACVSLAASAFVSAHADETEGDGKLHVSSIEELQAGENLSELEKPYTGDAIVDDYGRVVGSELNGMGFYNMDGVAFDDSYVSPSLSEDNVWTIDGVSASMTDEQLKAFWMCDAADCDPTEYVSIAIVGAYGETVECYRDDGVRLFSMTVTNEDGTCHIVIIDVTNRRDDFALTLKIYEEEELKEEDKIVLGTIYSSSSPINSACNYIVLDGDLEGSLEVDGKDLDGDPSPFAALFIDLNGHEWTSSSDAALKVASSDVSVFVYDSKGAGVIDCTESKTSAIEIYSGASLYLYGGTVTRSCDESVLGDDGEVENSSSGWYVINNHGNLYIYDGTAVKSSGVYSALVKNGWKSSGTEREDFYDSYSSGAAYAYIYGGVFKGGKYAFKNDSHAAAEIYGGDFSNHRLAAADNAGDGDLYIMGGTFSCDGPSGAELRNSGEGSIYIEDDAFEGSVCVLSGSVYVGEEKYEADRSGEPVYVDIYDGETSSYIDHDWDEGIVTKEPQCTVKGERTYTCSVCGETYTEEIQILGHLAGNPVKHEATCEEGACTVYECLRDGCSEILYQYTSDPLGHDWSETEFVCCCDKETEGDYFYSVCSVCGKEEIEYTGTWTHSNYVSFIAETATCDTPGSTVSFCADCGEWSYDEIAPLGHDYVSYISLQPSCEAAGETTFVCLHCGDTYTEPVETSGHTIAVIHIEATCESEGRDIEWCSVCGEVFLDVVTPATGHRWGSWTITRSATCTVNAMHTRTCSVCGATDGGEVENSMTDHTWVISSQKVASCDEDGYVTYKCSYCGATKTETSPATGHSYKVYQSDTYIEVCCADCGDILLSYDIPIYEPSPGEEDGEAETETETGAFVPDEDVTVNGDDGPSAPSENESESSVTVGGSAEDITESSSKPYVWLIIVCVCAVVIIAVALWLGYRSYKKSKALAAEGEGGDGEDEKPDNNINEDEMNEDDMSDEEDRSDEDEGE